MRDAIEIKQVNGTSIFYDRLYHCFYYWDNGRKRTSRNLNVLVNKLNK